MKGVPRVLRPLLNSLFRKQLDYPVMMDWTGDVSEDYDYQASLANIVVLSPSGQVRYRFNGKANPSELKQCFSRIDGLLEASVSHAEEPARAQ